MTVQGRVALFGLAFVVACTGVYVVASRRATDAATSEAERRTATGEAPWVTPAPGGGVPRASGAPAAAAVTRDAPPP